MKRAVEIITAAKKPVILAGHGITHSGAAKQVIEFAERRQIPVASTLLAQHSLYSHVADVAAAIERRTGSAATVTASIRDAARSLAIFLFDDFFYFHEGSPFATCGLMYSHWNLIVIVFKSCHSDPERTRGAEEPAFSDCYRIPTTPRSAEYDLQNMICKI